MQILGVRVDNLSRKEILEKIESYLSNEKPYATDMRSEFHQIATINPEFILKAQTDTSFRLILNKCDLNIADGIGIKFAFLRFGKQLKCRFAGVDLMHEILKIANKKKLNVFLAASKSSLSTWEETAQALRKTYPSIILDGDNIDPNGGSYELKATSYQLVLCNFGAPQQELFINSVKNDTIRLAMGVGGAFDFVTGKVKRAPEFWRKIGMEWLWRFLQEPRYRAKRIFKAVIVFPIKVLLSSGK